MIRNSFIFLSGVGEKTERQLWQAGIHDWDTYRDAAVKELPVRVHKHHEMHCRHLAMADAALDEQEMAPFARWLPASESWRVLDRAFDDTIFLDIETTGLSFPKGCTTVVGMHQPSKGTTLLVRGRDLDRESVQEALDGASALVTFNGRGFDMPFLQQEFGSRDAHLPHIDLMVALRRVGITGGLKRIEKQLGLDRGDELEGVDGYEAVKMWRRWERWGDKAAYDKLLAYNEADVVNMVPLARIAYDKLAAQMREEMEACRAAAPEPAPVETPRSLEAWEQR